MPEVFKAEDAVHRPARDHYSDMQDIEFTVQRGKLYMLQTRNGKHHKAALRIAVDMVRGRSTRRGGGAHRAVVIDRSCIPRSIRLGKVIAKGLPASPGASGKAVFSTEEAEKLARAGGKVIWCGARPARGHPRHARRRGHPDLDRQHDQPRRRGGARHGQARGGRRRRAHRRLSASTLSVRSTVVKAGEFMTRAPSGEIMLGVVPTVLPDFPAIRRLMEYWPTSSARSASGQR